LRRNTPQRTKYLLGEVIEVKAIGIRRHITRLAPYMKKNS
jgi:hypothetical protein